MIKVRLVGTWKNTDDRGVSGSTCGSVAKKRLLEAEIFVDFPTDVVDTSVRDLSEFFFSNNLFEIVFFFYSCKIFSVFFHACTELFSGITCPVTVLWKMFVLLVCNSLIFVRIKESDASSFGWCTNANIINVTLTKYVLRPFNPLNAKLNPICYLLALLAHHFLHVSRIRVKSLTLRLLMSYTFGAPILDVSRSHTTTRHNR